MLLMLLLLHRLTAGDAATGDDAVATCVAPTGMDSRHRSAGFRLCRSDVSRDRGRAEMAGPLPFVEAACFRQGRSGASRDIAATVLRRIFQERSRSNPKLPPLKRRVTFFCLKQQKKGNQRKMLLFESRARTSAACAGIFHTGHPCPDEKRPASLRAALRVFFSRR